MWAPSGARAQEAYWEAVRASDATDPLRIAVQASAEAKSRTFPFGLAISAQLTPGFLHVRTEHIDVRTSLGVRLRSPSHGTIETVARRVWTLGPVGMLELGSRIEIVLDPDWGIYLRGAARFGGDATRIDPEDLPGNDPMSTDLGAWVAGSHFAVGARAYFVHVALEVDHYVVLDQSPESKHREVLSQGPAVGLFAAARLSADIQVFGRVVSYGQTELLGAGAYTLGIAGSLVP